MLLAAFLGLMGWTFCHLGYGAVGIVFWVFALVVVGMLIEDGFSW